MKLIAVSTACLLVSSAQADETKSNLRTSRSRQLQTTTATNRQTQWIKAHNNKRKKYQTQYGGTYTSLKWNNALKNKAAALAKSMAKNNCQYQSPPNSDYGINFYRSAGSNKVPTVSSVMTLWEGTLTNPQGKPTAYPENGAMTQVLWSATKYVGCADAYSGDSANKCYATVCLYSKAGNCNMNSYLPNWKKGVIEGPGCGKCPPNMDVC